MPPISAKETTCVRIPCVVLNFLIESDYINAESIAVDGGQRYGHRKLEEG
ncbi:MAG: hypothetical protein HGB14_12795 [Anaerolineaceae bacterium]|nr:hypothetical protein [Anaerolineaceae bacterium]